MTIRLDVLGPPRLLDARGEPVAVPPGKPLALLIAVACSDHGWSRTDLAALLWPSSERGRARQSVRQALWFLRSRLGGEVLTGHDPVVVDRERLVTDRSQFLGLLGSGMLDEAATLWRGPFLEGFTVGGERAWDDWVERTRQELEVRYRGALQVAADSRRAAGDPAGSLPWLRKAAALMPHSEEGWASLVSAALDARLPGEAMDALAEARAVLDGVREGGPLAALEERLRAANRTQGGDSTVSSRPFLDLVGRGGELRQLLAHWHRAREGQGQVVVLSGASGIGKTRLADELGTAVRLQAGQVVRVRGHRGESRLPWGVAADLVRQLLDARGAAAISPTSDTLLRSLVPALARRDEAHPYEGRLPEPVALAEAFADLLLNVAYEEPILLVLDDLHWGDAESRALFLRVCRRITDAACMVVLVDRRSPGGAMGRTADIDALLERAGATSIVLPPLTVEDVAKALARAIHIPGSGEVHRIASRLHGISEGNPLFLQQLLGRLADDGILASSPGRRWSLDPVALPDDLPLPDSARHLVMDRLRRLSPDGARLTRALARHAGPASPGVLQAREEMDDRAFLAALGELRARGVVVPAEGGGLDFAHDLLREAAAREMGEDGSHPPAPAPRRRAWWPAAVLALAGIGTLAAIHWQREWHASPYAPGIVLVHRGGSAWELSPPRTLRDGWRWEPSRRDVPGHERARPALREDGSLSWVTQVDDPGAAPWVGEWNGSGWDPVWQEEGAEADYVAMAPGGRLLAGVRQRDEDRSGYRHDLWVVDVETRESSILYRAEEAISGRGSWSPDGSRIAVVLRGTVDTLLTLSPSGEGVRRITLPGSATLAAPAWCQDGEHLGLLAERAGALRPHLIHLASGTVIPLDGGAGSGSGAVCLGTPPALVYHGVHEGELMILKTAPHLAAATPLGANGPDLPHIDWVPTAPPALLRSVRIEEGAASLRPGEHRPLGARGEFRDGQVTHLDLEWTSTDPEVASVDGAGIVTGNGPGVTWIRASYRNWLTDSLRVEVVGIPGEGLLLWDTFQEVDPDRWLPVGRPVHGLADADGLLLADPLDPSRGLVVELEFRLPLSRLEDEGLLVALIPALPPHLLPPRVEEDLDPARGGLVLRYPSGSGVKRRPDLLEFVTVPPGVSQHLDAPGLPTDDRVRLALRIRSDGTSSVEIGGAPVGQGLAPLDLSRHPRWHLLVTGASADTDALVRSLRISRAGG